MREIRINITLLDPDTFYTLHTLGARVYPLTLYIEKPIENCIKIALNHLWLCSAAYWEARKFVISSSSPTTRCRGHRLTRQNATALSLLHMSQVQKCRITAVKRSMNQFCLAFSFDLFYLFPLCACQMQV